MNDARNAAENVKRAYNDACAAVDRALMDDRVLQAQDGKTTIANGFSYAETRERAAFSVEASRKEALDAIGKARRRAENALTAPPSSDEANFIIGINGRDDMTEREISAALSRYRGHAAQRAIFSAARRSGLTVYGGDMTEAEETLNALDGLETMANREFNLARISTASESGRLVAGNGFTAQFSGGSIQEQFFALLNG